MINNSQMPNGYDQGYIQGYPQSTPQNYANVAQNDYQNGPAVYQNSLCGCCADCRSCCCSFLCPACQYAQNYEKLQAGESGCCRCVFNFSLFTCLFCLSPLLVCNLRGNIKKKFGMPTSGCGDCLLSYICCCCTMAQDARELNERIAKNDNY